MANNHRLAVVTSAYTGFLCTAKFSDVHQYVEEVLGRSVWTHEMADEALMEELRQKAKPEFLKLWGLSDE